LETGSDIGHFPHGQLFLTSGFTHFANHDNPRMDAYTNTELDTFGLLQLLIPVSHGIEDTQTCPYCSLCVIFMRLGIAEIHQQAISQQLGNMPIVAVDHFGTNPLIGTHHFPIIFRVELGG
jgi:hypothetical protein